MIDHQKIEVKPPVIFFIRREQMNGFDLAEDCEPAVFVLIVKKPFIEKSLDVTLKFLFAKAGNYTSLYLCDTVSIQSIFELLAMENEADPQVNSAMTEGLLKALLAKVLESATPITKTTKAIKQDTFKS